MRILLLIICFTAFLIGGGYLLNDTTSIAHKAPLSAQAKQTLADLPKP